MSPMFVTCECKSRVRRPVSLVFCPSTLEPNKFVQQNVDIRCAICTTCELTSVGVSLTASPGPVMCQAENSQGTTVATEYIPDPGQYHRSASSPCVVFRWQLSPVTVKCTERPAV